MVKTMVEQVVPLQPMEDHQGAETHLQPMEEPMLDNKFKYYPYSESVLPVKLQRESERAAFVGTWHLAKKKNDFKWGPEQQQTFEQMKQEFHAVALGPVRTGLDVKNVLYTASGENGPSWNLWQKVPGETQGQSLEFCSQRYKGSETSWSTGRLNHGHSPRLSITVKHVLQSSRTKQINPFAMEDEEMMECIQEFPEHYKVILDRLNEQHEQDQFTDITLIVDGMYTPENQLVSREF
ncbi:hypothetical protein BTVI_13400 [Pitangus sulphuratus]|nr:hypothetical protein BTVI_13400 [Pitangus sulphuratus]